MCTSYTCKSRIGINPRKKFLKPERSTPTVDIQHLLHTVWLFSGEPWLAAGRLFQCQKLINTSLLETLKTKTANSWHASCPLGCMLRFLTHTNVNLHKITVSQPSSNTTVRTLAIPAAWLSKQRRGTGSVQCADQPSCTGRVDVGCGQEA